MSIGYNAAKYRDAKTPYDAIYAALEALDNNDESLSCYPQAVVDALAAVGYAVVPCELPPVKLADAQASGVFETGNPKHGWDTLIAQTRIGANALNPEGRSDG